MTGVLIKRGNLDTEIDIYTQGRLCEDTQGRHHMKIECWSAVSMSYETVTPKITGKSARVRKR